MLEYDRLEDLLIDWLKHPHIEAMCNNFFTKHGILYYKKTISNAIATIDDDSNLLFDLNVLFIKPLFILLPIIQKNTDSYNNFFMVYNCLKYHKAKKEQIKINIEDISNMIECYVDVLFFDKFKKEKFDFVDHLFKYIKYYNCGKLWHVYYTEEIKPRIDIIKAGNIIYRPHFLYKIERKDIIDEISTIDRAYKIRTIIDL